MKNSDVRLYNVLFPVWLLCFFPVTWIVVLPANFVIDLAVLFITLTIMKVATRKQICKSCILRVWLCGFGADLLGSILMFTPTLLDINNDLIGAINMNPFENVFALIWVTICLFFSAVCIYFFNLKYCLEKSDLDLSQKKKVALSMAIVTAPYLFYMPSEWIY